MAKATDSEDDRAEGRVPAAGATAPLPEKPSDASVPRHVAIIPDGNRRWAKREGLNFKQAYELAGQRLDRVVTHLVARGVRYVTVWPLSQRNWVRGEPEVYGIIATVQDYVRFARTVYPARGFQFRMIGSRENFRLHAPELERDLLALERDTAHETRATIVMAFDYGGREEIVQAVGRMLDAGLRSEDLSPETISRYLDTSFMPDPDIIVRTGGAHRLSGFMPYQAEYAELHFSDTLLPDLDEDEIDDILEQYARRRYSQ